MCRISLVIALSLLLSSFASSQQSAPREAANPTETPSSGTLTNCPTAQIGRIAVFTTVVPPNSQICNSGIYEPSPGTGPIGILNPNPTATLDVTGDINVSQSYQIGETTVLSIGTAADNNLFAGEGAGANNLAGYGRENTFVGYHAGQFNTRGVSNTFIGDSAGLYTTTGYNNTFLGGGTGVYNNVGVDNTFIGELAGYSNTNGNSNIFIGNIAGSFNTEGSSNVYIANQGPSSGTENNTIRIGMQGNEDGQQNAAYIAGIYGVNVAGLPVQINSSGQLGTTTSSLRFKEQVRDMGDSTDAIMELRPVTFLYKPEYAKGERTLQYGLIAEEVAKVYPELVAYDDDSQPYAVRYQYLSTMLLNEVQKQYRHEQAQELEIEQLKERISRLERLLNNQTQAVARK